MNKDISPLSKTMLKWMGALTAYQDAMNTTTIDTTGFKYAVDDAEGDFRMELESKLRESFETLRGDA